MRRKFVNLWALVDLFRTNIPSLINNNFEEKLTKKKLYYQLQHNKKDMLDNLIEQLLEAKDKYFDSDNSGLKEIFKRKINLLNDRIDKLMFERYGLTKEDFRLTLIKNYNS